MLLERLVEYAEQRLELPPPMYQKQPIRYIVNLTSDGRPLGPPIDTADTSSPETKNGQRRYAPHIKRTVGIKPKLLADTGIYALGVPGPDAKPERVRQQHAQFVELVDRCAEATGEPTVRAVSAFLAGLDRERLALGDTFDPAATITFQVGDTLPIDLPAVRAYWAKLNGADDTAAAETGTTMTCIVCGQARPALARHPLKIKGIPGGQILKDLISANARAFESYGLANSLIAPTCQRCAEAYGNALNALLADKTTSVWTAGLAYAFWTSAPVKRRWASLLSDPDPAEVRELMTAAYTGRQAAVQIDAAKFYAVGLGASGARAVVRDWIDTSVPEAEARLGRYFTLQSLEDAYGAPGAPLSVARIANATVRDPRKESPAPVVASGLIRLAVHGDPLPLDLLFLAVRRNRAEQDVSRERAALIKMVLGSRRESEPGEETWMTELDLSSTEPAYLCGRLLATLDLIQQRAIGSPNATIIDKFYGTASSAPASVFGTLLHGAQAHMGKLRRDQRGTFIALEAQLEEVLAGLAHFPPTLSLQEQGLFALGFYHQRAANRRAARERREQRDHQAALPLDQPEE